MNDQGQTNSDEPEFDFDAFPPDTVFHERRTGRQRRIFPTPKVVTESSTPKPERRVKKERRRRVDPTTFEKQYTDEELEFMNAMQHFKVQSGKSFPTHGDVLRVAFSLGYRKLVPAEPPAAEPEADGSGPKEG